MIKEIEFDRFLEELSKYTLNELTKKEIKNTKPLTQKSKLTEKIKLSEEFIKILKDKGFFPLSEFPDITHTLELLSIEESILSPQQILDMLKILKISREIKNFLSESIKDSNYLIKIYRDIHPSRETERIIEDSIDPSGMVKNSASKDLANIRKSIKEVEKNIITTLENIIHSQKFSDIIQEKLITVRRDRYVIPVKTNFSSKIKGIIQDRSSSGQTVYLEPVSVVEMNNKLSDLKLQEQIEIRKILKFLTDILRRKLKGLNRTFRNILLLDYLYTIGKYALKYSCIFPQISDEIYLKNAKHPLFLILNREFKPVDIIIDRKKRGLIITGPNTGGKTVTLKTAGIIAALFQSGIPVPVDEGSRIPVFDGIYADIGDMQSIEQNLSTFSAHIRNIKEILENATEKSLVLLDELIPGTDPEEGSAIGIGILEKLKEIGCYLMVTTHFKQIKIYALSEEYFSIASVGFDKNSLSPTYTLHYNSVGESMAFHIAQKLNLSKDILETSKKYLDRGYLDMKKALQELETFRADYEQKVKQLNILKREMELEKEKYARLNQELEKEKKKNWEIVRKEINNYINSLREEGYKILQEVKKTQTGKPLEEFILDKKKGQQTAVIDEIQTDQINIGDTVRLKGKNSVGEVISVRENKVHINFSGIKIWTDISQVEKVKTEQKTKKVNFSFKKSKKLPLLELKIIGKTKEEALKEVEQFIDRAVLEGLTTVRIIHGFGSGVLRKAVRDYLDTLPIKVRYEDAPYNEGGMGVTIVHIE